ncbi:MAG: hypothetical protein LAT55_06700 [Opitutales bacterium]|nr:hypothetical protein [Opitutales bacterium]
MSKFLKFIYAPGSSIVVALSALVWGGFILAAQEDNYPEISPATEELAENIAIATHPDIFPLGDLTFPEEPEFSAREDLISFPLVEEDEDEDIPVSIPELSAYAIVFGSAALLLAVGRRYLR